MVHGDATSAERLSVAGWRICVGWAPLPVAIASVLQLAPGWWPAWAVMWTLAGVIYAALKWLTWWGTRTPLTPALSRREREPSRGAPAWRQAAYLFLWPGMDAAAFLNSRIVGTRPSAGEWLFALAKFIGGWVVLYCVGPQVPRQWPYLVGWAGMLGVIMILHFGSFHLLSCLWRSLGIEARPLMNWPLLATGIADYWGRRWNTAFPDLTHRFIFRPLRPRLGAMAAILAVFLFSGLIHDLVVSVPPRGGYGGPTLFFVWQALAMFFERSATGRRLGLGHGLRGWLFTGLAVLLPAPLLFHVPFVVDTVVPFMRAVRAIP